MSSFVPTIQGKTPEPFFDREAEQGIYRRFAAIEKNVAPFQRRGAVVSKKSVAFHLHIACHGVKFSDPRIRRPPCAHSFPVEDTL